MFENMGKFATGDKPKFDLITASKTKKYKIITAVILVIGVLLLVGGILLRTTLTAAVAPNDLRIVGTLSGYSDGTCTLSQDEIFVLSTGTPQSHPLSEPIKFTLDEDAQKFLVIQDSKFNPITSSNYQGLFRFHITNPDVDNQSGKVRITCGTYLIEINVVYDKPE